MSVVGRATESLNHTQGVFVVGSSVGIQIDEREACQTTGGDSDDEPEPVRATPEVGGRSVCWYRHQEGAEQPQHYQTLHVPSFPIERWQGAKALCCMPRIMFLDPPEYLDVSTPCYWRVTGFARLLCTLSTE